jgi:hypothetical protein
MSIVFITLLCYNIRAVKDRRELKRLQTAGENLKLHCKTLRKMEDKKMTCMYNRDEQCFKDCPNCPRACSKSDPDDERDESLDWEEEE